MHLVIASALNLISPKHNVVHSSGVSVFYVFSVVVGIAAILAFIFQMNDKIRGRKFKKAYEAFMESVEADKSIESSRQEFKDLRLQIEVEIPRQARIAYLKERLAQVESDLSHFYNEYVTLTKELQPIDRNRS